MSSYEKQMQWKKAASVKAKKHLEERDAEQEFSFAPVFYTQSTSKPGKEGKPKTSERETAPRSHSHRSSSHHRSDQNGRSNSQSKRHDDQHGDHAFYSPVGAGSVDSHSHSRYSDSSPQDDGGYSGSYADAHREERQRHPRGQHASSSHHYSESHNRRLEPAVEGDEQQSHSGDEEGAREGGSTRRTAPSSSNGAIAGGRDEGYSRQARSAATMHSHSGSKPASDPLRNNAHRHQGRHPTGQSSSSWHDHRRVNHNSNSRSRSGSRSGSSSDGESLGAESRGPEEPIIELLERERRQWREEREQLIQCIHLQQLELAQRSVAAHDRAADIAKEFARAIECFEERLVSVEGTVQKEIMGIKGVAEALLHAANAVSGAHNSNSNGNSSSNHAGTAGSSAASVPRLF